MLRRRRFWVRVAALGVVVVLCVIFRAPLGRALVAGILDVATGYRFSFNSLEVAADHLTAGGLDVRRGSELLLTARRVAISYDLHGLLPGGSPRFGLQRVELDDPVLTISRHADGNFNVKTPSTFGTGGGAAPSRGQPSRTKFSAKIVNGRVEILDPYRVWPGSRKIVLDSIDVVADVDTTGTSRYSGHGNVSTAGDTNRFPFGLLGRSELPRGFAMYRLSVANAPLPDLVNYIINSKAAAMHAGVARGLVLRVYALDLNSLNPEGFHLTGSTLLERGVISVPGLRRPLTEMNGRLDVYDGGLAAPHVTARLAGFPINVTGAVFGWSRPEFRIAATGSGALEQTRTLFTFAQRLPIAGQLATHVTLVGPVDDPFVATRFDSGAARYAQYPLRDLQGLALYYSSSVILAPARAHYGPVAVDVHGTLDLGDQVASDLVVDADAPRGTLPYIAQAVPGAPLHATGLVEGANLAVQARGVVDGSGNGDRIAGFFDVDRNGDGIIGPLAASRADGSSLAGAFFLNRTRSESAFWLDASNYQLALNAAHPLLPGLPALAPPQFSGRVSASLAGEGRPSTFAVAGRVRGSDVQAGPLHFDSLDAALAGSPDDAHLGAVNAAGPWGGFSGRGAFYGGRLALTGDYRGSFEQLEPLTGNLGARGSLAGPLAVLVASERIVVQTSGASSPGATVHGVPVDSVRGTLAVAGSHLDVLAATADVGGGALAASGSLGPGERVGVSVIGVDARRLRAAGAPLSSGSVDAIGSVFERNGLPTFEGGIALGDGRLDVARVRGLGVSGNGDVVADSNVVHLSDTNALVGPAFGTLAGTVGGIGSVPYYRLNVDAVDVPIGPFARLVFPRRNDIDGTLDSRVVVAGNGNAVPAVSGSVALPEGTFDGQAFRSARAQIDAGGRTLVASGGSMIVGSTAVAFNARVSGPDAYLRLDVPRANLSDFDDLFDTGDTLGGTGKVAGTFERHGTVVNTLADAQIADLRYRRFDLGDANLRWTSRRSRVDGHVRFGGSSGTLAADGSLTLATRAPFDRLLQRSAFNGTATLSGLDLGVWIPALGYEVPVVGRVDGSATFGGSVSNPEVVANAAWTHGALGKLPIDQAVLSFSANRRSVTIKSGQFAIESLLLTASGSLGLGERDPLALSLHAKSNNVGSLAGKFIKLPLTVTGYAEADVKVDGTRAKPHASGGLDVENATLNGVAVPRALGEFDIRGRDVVISGTELNFAKGTLLLAGSVPFTVSPFALGPPNAPISLDLTANGIDLTDFAPLLPHDSTLAGRFDGHVGIGGMAGTPRLVGDLSVASGVLQSPFETVPLTNLSAQVSFAGNELTLKSAHAEAGGGTLDLHGNALVPDLVHPGADASYSLHGTAKALHLELPTYGSGIVDGTLDVTHAPGSLASLNGNVTVQDGVIPFSALLIASQLGGGGPQFPTNGVPQAQAQTAPRFPDANLSLNVTAGNNMRVRSGSVDLGGRGMLSIGGTVRAPSLTGQFTSTGGTLSYFNTVFRVQSGTVTFSPDQGLVPWLDAVATTQVINPDPDPVRNPTGTADITVNVTGPVNTLNIALSSDPSYDREQILGLLLSAPAIGADIFASQTPGQPFGASAFTGQTRNSGGISVGEEAFGVINAQFTRNLLSPIETAFGGALGLSSLAFNINYTGSVGLSARKILGKTADLIYATSFTYPYRQTFGFDLRPNATTAAQVTVFGSLGQNVFGALNPYYNPGQPVNQRATAAQPSGGTVGFSLSLQRLYP